MKPHKKCFRVQHKTETLRKCSETKTNLQNYNAMIQSVKISYLKIQVHTCVHCALNTETHTPHVCSVRDVPGVLRSNSICCRPGVTDIWRLWFPKSSASRQSWSFAGAWVAQRKPESLHGVKELNETELDICSSSRLQRLPAHSTAFRMQGCWRLVIQKRRTTWAWGGILERKYKGYPTWTTQFSTTLAPHALNGEQLLCPSWEDGAHGAVSEYDADVDSGALRGNAS